jgi:cell division transport system permease protein
MFEGDENPLRDVFVVNTALPEQTAPVAEEINNLDYVSEVNYGGATADQLFELMDRLQVVGIIAAVVLIVVAIFLISNTIRITILSRQREVEIMKLVGATNWFIRWPFVIEGALIGFIGALIPVIILTITYNTVFDRIMGFLSGTNFAILPPVPFLVYLSIGMILTGVVIGAVGSSMSIRRFLDV